VLPLDIMYKPQKELHFKRIGFDNEFYTMYSKQIHARTCVHTQDTRSEGFLEVFVAFEAQQGRLRRAVQNGREYKNVHRTLEDFINPTEKTTSTV
jgi:hypothetical protein